ncbi:hypothetical protein MMC25_005689 [Agyrium rufum]|nr:hypothetical protein [Agyrium rufum]
MSSTKLPKTHRALVLTSTDEPLKVESLPTPQASPGSAIIRIHYAGVLSYMGDVYNGTRHYTFPTPFVTGTSAVGRVVTTGPDATLLQEGQLVIIDSLIRSRDEPSALFLSGLHDGGSIGSKKLMEGEWRNSTFAEYYKCPLENCHAVDEARLLGYPENGGLGYEIEDLIGVSRMLVPFGGLVDIDLRPGETVIVCPATGSFGGAAVQVALAMGARVIATGRNAEKLQKVASTNPRIEAVAITGDVQQDLFALQRFGPVDAFFDISPSAATQSTHFKSCILALRHGGRVSFMGGIHEDLLIPHYFIMRRNITLKGTWMYKREDIGALLKMVNVGVLKLGKEAGAEVVGKFGLDDWAQAFEVAKNNSAMGQSTMLAP